MMPVGQLFIAGFDGTSVPPDLAALLRDDHLGGVILFRRNIASVGQLQALTAELRERAGRPLLIAVDHEGGRVFRMPPPFTPIPPMAVIGGLAIARPNDDVAYRLGRLMGRELAAAGIVVNFAPVLDLNTNPDNPIIGDRAFHADPALVARLGCDAIRGMLAGGVLPCGKHFPGHGDTPEDSHIALPVMPATWDRLHRFELKPFAAAIAAGVPLLMTAHILYGVIDPILPVTLSKRAIYTLLREELAYDGAIVTDDLQMGAIARQWPAEEAAVMALAAGCDLLLICRDPAVTRRAIHRARGAVARGELHAAAIERALARVRRLLDQVSRLPSPPPAATIGAAEHREFLKQLKEFASR